MSATKKRENVGILKKKTGGGMLSDQFDHFKLILLWVPECSFCKKIKENGIKGRGVPYSHIYQP